MIEVTSDEQLVTLLSNPGFLVNVDYPTRDVKLHSIHCKYCDPRMTIGVKPSSKNLNNTGEFGIQPTTKRLPQKQPRLLKLEDTNTIFAPRAIHELPTSSIYPCRIVTLFFYGLLGMFEK